MDESMRTRSLAIDWEEVIAAFLIGVRGFDENERVSK